MNNPSVLILNDKHYIECLKLARLSKGNERYGSLLVKDEQIIGEGFNRAIAHSLFGRLERKIRQGMANHAEIEAMNDALMKNIDIKGAELYVAGYFPKNGQLFFKTDYTCRKCIPFMWDYQISFIYSPTPEGWIKKSLIEAEKEAQEFTNETHQKRLNAIIGKFFISQINLSFSKT